jgi:predicted phosphodiesterase
MRLAVIADVHANNAALEAVLEAIEGSRPEALLCLGDLVGYNAEPSECIARIRASARLVVAGNHDVDVARPEPAGGTNASARLVQEWTRSRLGPEEVAYLSGLPALIVEPQRFVAVHGCYLNRTYYSGYVTTTMLEANLRAIAAHEDWPQLAFCGHTHAPLVGWIDGQGCQEPRLEGLLRWPMAATVLVNPGSVGQPRDGDPRAAFAIVDSEARSVEVRRVAYDVERSVRAIADAGLPAELGERLREGR